VLRPVDVPEIPTATAVLARKVHPRGTDEIQAVRGPDLRHSRYRGLAKAHVQNVMTGMAINLTRLGAWFLQPEPTKRRPTRVHELCVAYGLAAA
jgi:hypothetical protein